MAMSKFVLLVTVITVILGVGTKADVDCKSQPSFGKSMNCCRIIQPDMSKFPECEKIARRVNRKTFPCITSCVLNSTKAMDQNGKLVMPNLRTALNRLFNADETTMDNIVLPAFKDCETEAETAKTELENKSPLGGADTDCPTLPLLYFMCASDKLFLKCPAKYWTSSDECQSIKNYVSQCGRYFNTPGKLSGRRGGRRSRS